jgi:diguanylate cyclase (GGDEF)-like protein
MGVSRTHCRLIWTGRSCTIEDLGSTNGTLVNGIRVRAMGLRSGDRIQIGEDVVLQFALLDRTEESLARGLYEQATRDPLTKAFNRRYFASRLTAELAHAHRHQTPLSLLLLDLDFFKSVNDRFGHHAGDELLKKVVEELQHMIRVEDLLARFGGEEFVLLARDASLENAMALAERIRAHIESLHVDYEGQAVSTTASIGVAEMLDCGAMDPDAFIAIADSHLYSAKARGRNRVSCG